MDSIVEENGNSSSNLDDGGHNLSSSSGTPSHHQNPSNATSTIVGNASASHATAPTATAASVLTSVPITSYHLQSHGIPVQSVIQSANPSSVIQTNTQSSIGIPKLVYVSKQNNSVIHSTPGAALHIKPEPNTHHLDTSEDSITDEDSPRRKDLTRRPSYHKIFNDISGPDISAGTTLQMPESAGLTTITSTMGTAPGAGTVLHIPPDNPTFYIPNRISYNTNNSGIAEDQTRKREIRLQKNREAARECRRKKKEYIKCLENRVAVLENQNKALIEELKSLKELYCQTKND